MYDISQLNDLLVPELLDIADHFTISNAKKLNKQDLITQILDKQSHMNSAKNEEEKPKRKRIIKPADDAETAPEPKPAAVKAKKPEAEKKQAVKRVVEKEEEEELQPITSEQSTIPAAIAQMLQAEDGDVQLPETQMEETPQQQTKQYQQRNNQQAFNIEFDGVILGEGVLEMMPDGYGFLRSSDYNY